jgi:hypothetical protein
MRTFIFLLALFISSAATMGSANAASVDGVYRNADEKIIISIESTTNGIRAKWSGRDTWDTYNSTSSTRYTDNKGNTIDVLHKNEIAWREKSSGRTIRFERMFSVGGNGAPIPPPDPEPSPRNQPNRDGDVRDKNDDWNDDVQRDGRRERPRPDTRVEYGDRSRFAGLTGQWFNQKTRHSIYVQGVDNGLRISTGRAKPMLFAPSRDSKVFRSRNGDTLTWLNDHTLQLKNNGKENLIFHRADNNQQQTKGKGHYKEKSKSNGKGHAYGHDKKMR